MLFYFFTCTAVSVSVVDIMTQHIVVVAASVSV